MGRSLIQDEPRLAIGFWEGRASVNWFDVGQFDECGVLAVLFFLPVFIRAMNQMVELQAELVEAMGGKVIEAVDAGCDCFGDEWATGFFEVDDVTGVDTTPWCESASGDSAFDGFLTIKDQLQRRAVEDGNMVMHDAMILGAIPTKGKAAAVSRF